jgi:hypothetical protein
VNLNSLEAKYVVNLIELRTIGEIKCVSKSKTSISLAGLGGKAQFRIGKQAMMMTATMYLDLHTTWHDTDEDSSIALRALNLLRRHRRASKNNKSCSTLECNEKGESESESTHTKLLRNIKSRESQ